MKLRGLLLCALVTACGSSESQDGDPLAGSGAETNSGGDLQPSAGNAAGGASGSGLVNAGSSGEAAGRAGSSASGAGGASGSGGKSSSGGSGSPGGKAAEGGAAGALQAEGGAPDCAVPRSQDVTKVACVGDSITAGHGASASSKSYPGQLSVLLGNEYGVGNFGRDSATMLKNGDLPYWNQTQFGAAKAYLPNIVVIGLGTNDMNSYGNYAKLAQFSDDYAAMVDVFRGLESHPVIFAVLPIWVKEDNPGTGLTNARLADVIALIEGVAAAKSLCTIDLNTPFTNHGELYSDTIHPNDAGYALMAKTVCQAIGGSCQ